MEEEEEVEEEGEDGEGAEGGGRTAHRVERSISTDTLRELDFPPLATRQHDARTVQYCRVQLGLMKQNKFRSNQVKWS